MKNLFQCFVCTRYTVALCIVFVFSSTVTATALKSGDIRNHLGTRTPYRYKFNKNDSKISFPGKFYRIKFQQAYYEIRNIKTKPIVVYPLRKCNDLVFNYELVMILRYFYEDFIDIKFAFCTKALKESNLIINDLITLTYTQNYIILNS